MSDDPGKKIDFADLLDGEATQDPVYLLEYAILEFTEAIARRMEELGWSQAWLARQLGQRSSQVSEFMAGCNAPNLRTMIRYAKAVGMKLEIKLVPVAASNSNAALDVVGVVEQRDRLIKWIQDDHATLRHINDSLAEKQQALTQLSEYLQAPMPPAKPHIPRKE